MFVPTAARLVPRLVHYQHFATYSASRIGFTDARKISDSARGYVVFTARFVLHAISSLRLTPLDLLMHLCEEISSECDVVFCFVSLFLYFANKILPQTIRARLRISSSAMLVFIELRTYLYYGDSDIFKSTIM